MENKKKILITTFFLFALFSISANGMMDDEYEISDEVISNLQREFIIYENSSHINLNPQTSAYVSEAQILNGLYEGLFSYNPRTLEPDLAIAESYRISRDKLRWSFSIRSDAKFSDGTNITAQDVKNSWLDLIQNPAAYYASLLDIIKGAREARTGKGGRDDVAIFASGNTLSIELEKPASHLPKILCHHAFSVVNENGAFSGAFKITSFTPFELILEKNENYWDSKNVNLPKIKIIFSDDAELASHAFNTGCADWLNGVFNAKTILDKDSLQFSQTYGTAYYFFKNTGGVWQNPDFRNALLCALDWAALREGNMFPATTLVCQTNGYKSPEGIDYTDVEDAKLLFERAKEKIGLPVNEEITLRLAITPSDYFTEQVKIFKKAACALGIKLETVTVPEELYLTSVSTTDADLFNYTWIGDFADPLAFLELFRSDSTMNESRWKNTEFDSLLDKACFTNDEDEHYAYLSKAEDILLGSGEVLPICHPLSLNAVDIKTIGGWSKNTFNLHPFKSLFIRKQTIRLPNVVMNTKP